MAVISRLSVWRRGAAWLGYTDIPHGPFSCIAACHVDPAASRLEHVVEQYAALYYNSLERRPRSLWVCALAGFNVRGGHHSGEAYSCFNALE